MREPANQGKSSRSAATEEVRRRTSARQIAAEREARQRRIPAIAGTAVVVVAFVLGFVILAQRQAGPGFEVRAAEPLPAEIAQDGRVMGDPTAPVTVVEWGDYT